MIKRRISALTALAFAAALATAWPRAALAQTQAQAQGAQAPGQQWFVPGGGGGGTGSGPRPRGAASGRPATRSSSLPAPPAAEPLAADTDPASRGADSYGAAADGPRRQIALPSAPPLPPIAPGAPPPTAVIGVIGVQDIMRQATAAQQVERIIGERRARFQADAQKEQANWREIQQSFLVQRSTLSPEQIRGREKELQDRITKAQREFQDRDRIIQEAARYGIAQIERTMVGVISQVADSHGMNIVLHRPQVALNKTEFDITDQVTAELNKVLPSVELPADGAPVPTVVVSANPPNTAQAAISQPPAPTAGSSSASAPASVMPTQGAPQDHPPQDHPPQDRPPQDRPSQAHPPASAPAAKP